MTPNDAALKINQHPDLTATVRGGAIQVSMYGRPAGQVTTEDLEALGHTPTGWGKNLRKGAYQVWQALQS